MKRFLFSAAFLASLTSLSSFATLYTTNWNSGYIHFSGTGAPRIENIGTFNAKPDDTYIYSDFNTDELIANTGTLTKPSGSLGRLGPASSPRREAVSAPRSRR